MSVEAKAPQPLLRLDLDTADMQCAASIVSFRIDAMSRRR
jgi:hypothetical protein